MRATGTLAPVASLSSSVENLYSILIRQNCTLLYISFSSPRPPHPAPSPTSIMPPQSSGLMPKQYSNKIHSNLVALYVYKKTIRVLIAPGIISLLIGFTLLIYNVFLWVSGVKSQIISDQILILFIVFGAQLSITGFVIEIIKNRSN